MTRLLYIALQLAVLAPPVLVLLDLALAAFGTAGSITAGWPAPVLHVFANLGDPISGSDGSVICPAPSPSPLLGILLTVVTVPLSLRRLLAVLGRAGSSGVPGEFGPWARAFAALGLVPMMVGHVPQWPIGELGMVEAGRWLLASAFWLPVLRQWHRRRQPQPPAWRGGMQAPAAMAWIIAIEMAVLALLVGVVGIGSWESGRGAAPGEIAEALWTLLLPLVPYLAVRTVLAYLVAHFFSTGSGDSFATTMACSAGVLAAGDAVHRPGLWQNQLLFAAGGALLAYLSTYFVALRHRPAATPGGEPVPVEPAPATPAAAAPAPAPRPEPRSPGTARPVHHPAVAAALVFAFLGTLALLTLPSPWQFLLDDPLVLFQAVGTACLMACACAEAARHWRPLAAIQLLAGLVLLVLQMARHSFLMMQRNFLDTVPFGLAGKLAAYLIEMPAACLHDTSLACDLMLGAITHSAPLVLGLSVVLGAVMLWTLIHRVGRLRRQTAGGPIANAVTPPR